MLSGVYDTMRDIEVSVSVGCRRFLCLRGDGKIRASKTDGVYVSHGYEQQEKRLSDACFFKTRASSIEASVRILRHAGVAGPELCG